MSTTVTSLHPVRWAAAILVGLPVLLFVTGLVAEITQHREFAQSMRNALRYILLAEFSLFLVLAMVGAVYERRSQARDLRLYPPPGRLIDIGGYNLHLYCTGEGSPTVVLEHGLDGSFLDWRLVQPQIARFARVCSYDRAGYGWSSRSPKARIPSVMAEELHTLLANAGERPPFILVGHSMGAFDVLMYAHRYQEEVAAIVLVDGSHPDEPLAFPWRQKLELRFLQLTTPFGLPRWRNWCGGQDPALRPLRASVNCKSRVFRTHYEQWSAWASAAAEVRGLPHALNCPLILISRDPARGRNALAEQHWTQLQKKLLQLSPSSRQIIAEGSGHAVPGQRPDIIVEAVREFVKPK